jgi:surfeit locus 1 family protein
MMIKRLFSRRWWWSTLLVIAACIVMVRLGLWQLDRMEWKRAITAQQRENLAAETLVLDANTLQTDLESQRFRSVVVRGEYDMTEQVGWRNQVWEGLPGYHLITPLRIEGTNTAILINRGWVPVAKYFEGEPIFPMEGTVEVAGMILSGQIETGIGYQQDPIPFAGTNLNTWNLINIPRIDEQIEDYDLLPVFIQQAADPTLPANPAEWPESALPYAGLPTIQLDEGPHLGYAIQWFTFALILAIGYPLFIRQEDKSEPVVKSSHE